MGLVAWDRLRLTGRQVDISLSSILSFSTHPINLSLFPVSLKTSRQAHVQPFQVSISTLAIGYVDLEGWACLLGTSYTVGSIFLCYLVGSISIPVSNQVTEYRLYRRRSDLTHHHEYHH